MSNKLDKIFRSPGAVSKEDLLNYLSNRLSMDERRRVEALLADNPFYADAIEGLEMLDEPTRNRLIEQIQQENVQLVHENSSATDWKQLFKIAAAAAIALLIGLFFLFKADDIKSPLDRNVVASKIVVDSSTKITGAFGNVQKDNLSAAKAINNEEDKASDAAVALNDEADDVDDEQSVKIAKEKEKTVSNSMLKQRKTAPVAAAPMYAETLDTVGKRAMEAPAVQSETTTTTTIEKALKKFSKGKYEKAILLFEKELLTNPGNQKAAYYCGLAYYELQNYKAAHIKFSDVVNAPVGPYTEDALWYKAQTQLSLRDSIAAKNCLQQIISGNGKHRIAAQQLLNRMH